MFCYNDLNISNPSEVCQCLLFLDDAKNVAKTLNQLIQSGDSDPSLEALQVAFDLHENLNTPFLLRVISSLPTPEEQLTSEQKTFILTRYLGGKNKKNTTESSASSSSSAEAEEKQKITEHQEALELFNGPLAYPVRMLQLKAVLSGEIPGLLQLKFLYGHNATDMKLLNHIKDKLEPRYVSFQGYLHIIYSYNP